MTDTPETDAMEYFDAMCDPDRVVEAGFARRLERERDMYERQVTCLLERLGKTQIKMTDTPETDAMSGYATYGETQIVNASFARRLERERDRELRTTKLLLVKLFPPDKEYFDRKLWDEIYTIMNRND